MNFLFPLPRSSDVVRSLHSHERVHLHSKGFLNTKRHVSGEVGLAVQEAGKRRPRNPKCKRRRGYGKASGLNDFGSDEITGMARAFYRQNILLKRSALMVVFKIHIVDFALGTVDAES